MSLSCLLTLPITLYTSPSHHHADDTKDDTTENEPILPPPTPPTFYHLHMIPITIILISTFLSLVAASLPYCIARTDTITRIQIIILSCIHMFIAGIFITTSLLIYIPESLLLLPNSQCVMLIFLCGLFIWYTWEHICIYLYVAVTKCMAKNVSKTPIVDEDTSADEEFPRTARRRTRGEHQPIIAVNVPTYGTSASHYGHASQISPTNVVTSSTISSSTTTSSTSLNIRDTVNAAEYVAGAPYMARCVMCKDTIKNSKGMAYHAAGCQTKTLPYLSSIDRSLHGYRGPRQDKRITIESHESPVLLWCIIAPITVIMGQAIWNVDMTEIVTHNPTVATLLTCIIQVLTLISYHWFISFTLGLSLKQGHLSLAVVVQFVLIHALLFPAGMLLNIMLSTYMSTPTYHIYIAILQSLAAGILVYMAVVEILLEEWERRDATTRKLLSFVTGMGIVIVITFLT